MRRMQSIFRRSSHEMPGLNLASMPDLIFTVLFFFMIVTHMRHDNVKVRYEVPAGTEVQKLQQKSAVINVYVSASQIQVNSQVTDLDHLAALIEAERKKLSEEYYNKDTEDKNIAEVIIAKQRSGPLGTVKLAWLSETTTFANLARDDTPGGPAPW